MGLNCTTFDLILENGFSVAWNTTPIPRSDTSSHGQPHLGARSLDAAGALGLVLHYLASGIHETSLQQIFAIIPTTATRYIHFGLCLLLRTLRTLPDAAISWPKDEEFAEYEQLIIARHDRLAGAFSSMDGLKLPVQVLEDMEIENAVEAQQKQGAN
ncbi:hypothetical protein BC834DRAFT_974603 [Gloeopeniophorella convolvens]|nr:hypothetical protein BC834DRAFT_974603 [Gloeopeniophorella convolvens]